MKEWKERGTETKMGRWKETEKGRERFHHLIHYSDACQSQGCTRPNSGGKHFMQVPTWVWGTLVCKAISYYPIGSEESRLYTMPIWDWGITGGGFTAPPVVLANLALTSTPAVILLLSIALLYTLLSACCANTAQFHFVLFLLQFLN